MKALALLVLVGCCGAPAAQACAIEDCPGLPSACYNLVGAKWCSVTQGYNPGFGHWTPVHVFNHTRYGAAFSAAVAALNAPPVAPGNSLWLIIDADANAHHDIDIWEANSADWWWGYATNSLSTPGCYAHNAISINVTRFPTGFDWKVWVFEHELGHAIGLGHVCQCGGGRVMNPCTECASPAALSTCDAQGIAALYH